MKENILGKNLRQLRIDKKISQRNLGQKLGVANQTISSWENGDREPDIDTLIKIADYFCVTLDYIVGRERL